MGIYVPPSNVPPWFPVNGLLTGLGAVGSVSNPLAPFGSIEPLPPTLLGGFGGLALSTTSTSPPYHWWYVTRRFSRLLANLTVTDRQRQDGETKHGEVRACLNRHYWGHGSPAANSRLIGSWGKDTRVRPQRDIDILFLLPASVYWRFQERVGNRQSQLLQEVKTVLAQRYPQTTMRADGQVIIVPFDTVEIEISPGFVCQDGSIIVCDTNRDGAYKTSTAAAEAVNLDASDLAWNGNTRALVRLMKQWQRHCNVPIKSFHLERLAVEFLDFWQYSYQDVFYYDWMVRDFLAYLTLRAGGSISMPGTGEVVFLGTDWLSRARTAHRHAAAASNYEFDNYEALAGGEWKEIFGSTAPVLVS